MNAGEAAGEFIAADPDERAGLDFPPPASEPFASLGQTSPPHFSRIPLVHRQTENKRLVGFVSQK